METLHGLAQQIAQLIRLSGEGAHQPTSSSDSASGCSQTSMRLALGPSLRAKSPSGPRCELVCFMVVMGGMVAGVEVIDPQWSDQAVSILLTALRLVPM